MAELAPIRSAFPRWRIVAAIANFASTTAQLALILLLSAVFGSCNRQPAAPAPREPLHIVTPIYILADIARQVGGERVDVQWWIEDGQSPADLQETPQRRNQLHNADFVISRGLIDAWTTEGFSSEYETQRLVRLDRLPAAHDDDPQQYFWLDPYVALDLADELAKRFSVRDPRNDTMFRQNAAEFRKRVLQVCDQIRPTMDNTRGGFLSLDRGFIPLARRFSLHDVQVASIDLTNPSPDELKSLRATAKTASAHALFVNDQIPSALLRDLQTRLDLSLLTLDATGSSAPSSGHSTYVDVLQYNLGQIAKGMTEEVRR